MATILVAAGSAIVTALSLALRIGSGHAKMAADITATKEDITAIREDSKATIGRLDENELRLDDLNLDRVRRDERWTHFEKEFTEHRRETHEQLKEIRSTLKEMARRAS